MIGFDICVQHEKGGGQQAERLCISPSADLNRKGDISNDKETS